MQPTPNPINPPHPADRSLRAVFVLVVLVLLARIIYLTCICGYELVEDEAHYWLWAQYPDWSYYTKGPGVAWAIWLSTHIFGNAEWAVRLPTAIAGAIGALAAGALARDLAADAIDPARTNSVKMSVGEGLATPGRVGLLAALAYSLVPCFQGASVFMTIDGPYVACWSVACWAFWQAHVRGRGAMWLLFGAALGLGFLFKYTILLLVPGLIAYAIIARRRYVGERPRRSSPFWFALGTLIALTGLAPVLIWNSQHGWPTIAHLLGHLGMRGGDVPITSDGGSKWSPWWLPELIGEQIGIVGPWLVLAVLALRTPRRAGKTFLLCAAAPILIFYAIVALIAEPEGNWPMAAYATLMPLAAWLAADALAVRQAARARSQPTPGAAQTTIFFWRAGLGYALAAAIVVHALDHIGDAALALARQKWFHDAFVSVVHREPRDPAGRVRGAREMAAHVRELMILEESNGKRAAFVIAQHYGRASQLAYYLRQRGHGDEARFLPSGSQNGWWVTPEVYCAMHQTGGRRSQFDIWPETSLDLPHPELLGRPAVIITSTQPHMLDQWRTMFERVEPIPGERLRGEAKPDRSALLGYGWKGVPGITAKPIGTPVPTKN